MDETELFVTFGEFSSSGNKDVSFEDICGVKLLQKGIL